MGGRGGGSPSQRGNNAQVVAPSVVPASVAPGNTPDERTLIQAYWQSVADRGGLEGQTDKWIRLPEIRETMAAMGVSQRDRQDAAIKSVALRRDTRVAPVANLKSISQADRSAAIMLGGEPKHAMLMYP